MTLLPYQNQSPDIAAGVFIASGALVIGDVKIEAGSSVWFNTVIRGDVCSIRIGKKTNIQDLCVIHVTSQTHSTHIGNQVTVGHRVILHGCSIGDRALIGMGSILLDGAEIAEESMIGAGSLVTPNTKIPPRTLALGSPCRVVRELRDEEVIFLQKSAENYFELSQKYLQQKFE